MFFPMFLMFLSKVSMFCISQLPPDDADMLDQGLPWDTRLDAELFNPEMQHV